MICKPKRTCSYSNDNGEKCKEFAIFGINEPIHCENHKLNNEICWLVKKCSHCGRDNEILNKNDLCGICCDVPFYEQNKRFEKMKESTMIRYLRENLKLNNSVKEILADRIIDSTCNLYRPDILYDCGTHIVIIECDENQHKNYNWQKCSLNKSLEHMEEKRMYEIMVAYGLPTIFLRYNPDNFDIGGKISKKYNSSKRLDLLKKWVEYSFINEPKHQLVYKKLFYDEYNESDISFKRIDERELI